MAKFIDDVSDIDFCLSFGELRKCMECNGCDYNCALYESQSTRLNELNEHHRSILENLLTELT